MAKYVISRMTSLCEALPGNRCAKFFIPACECLLRFCRAFPPLSMDTSSLLLLIGQLTASRAAGSCGDELGMCVVGTDLYNMADRPPSWYSKYVIQHACHWKRDPVLYRSVIVGIFRFHVSSDISVRITFKWWHSHRSGLNLHFMCWPRAW